MNSFLGLFTGLVTRFFNWDIDEYKTLINNFFIKLGIDNVRDITFFCDQYLNSPLSGSTFFVVYDASKDLFVIETKKPKKGDYIQSIEGNSKIDSIVRTIKEAKNVFSKSCLPPKAFSGEEGLVVFLKNRFDETMRPILVQQIWDYVGKDNDNSALWSFYWEKLNEAFYRLMKSLLIGEYLILDDFIEQLESCSQMIGDLKDDAEIKYLDDSIPRFKALIKNSYHAIKSAHSTIMGSLSQPGKQSKYTFYIGGVGHHKCYSEYNQSEEEKFQFAIEALVHVILIDHIFITTPQNIETLHWAAHIIEETPGMKTNPRLQEVCEPLLDKIYMMLRQMLEDKSEEPQLQTEFRFGEDGIKKSISLRHIEGDESSPFSFKKDGVFRDFSNFDEDVVQIEWDQKSGFRGIDTHNDFASYNCSIRREIHQKIRKGIKEKDESVFEELERITEGSYEDKALTTSLLYHALKFIDNDIVIKEESMITRKHRLVSFLLNRLEEMVRSYSSCEIIPQKFSLPFILNYYSIESNDTSSNVLKPFPVPEQKYESLKDTVSLFGGKRVALFLSAGLKPTNINFLSRFVDRQKNKAENQYFEFLRGQEERVSQRMQDRWDKTMDSIHKDLEQQKNTNLQLVGYLGSFIAFVAVAVNAFKEGSKSSDVEAMQRMLVIITSCILSFAVMIRIITLPRDKELGERITSIVLSVLLSIALIAVIVNCLMWW